MHVNLQNTSFRRGFLFAFVLGFMVRLIPEVLSFPYPIGFDTVDYAARMKNGIVWHHWTSLFSTWMLYTILILTYKVAHVEPFLLLKVVAPILYGLNVCGMYHFAKRALGWETRNALIAGVFFAFQLAALRISWDLYRNALGLATLLFTLSLIHEVETRKGFAWFSLLSIFVVFSHEYASVIMFTTVLGVIINSFLKGEKVRSARIVAAVLPALVIFLTSVYLRMTPVPFHLETNVISVNDSIHPSPGKLFFLVNYLNVFDSVQHYPTYMDLASHIFSLFSVLYLLCLPLVFVGFFRNDLLDGWTSLILVGSFSALVIPFCALDLWNRWMFMLVYPFTLYVVNGIVKVSDSQGGAVNPNWKWLGWMKISKRTMFAILLCGVLLGTTFMMVTYADAGLIYTPTTISYIPSTMLHNTVPLRDVDDTVEVMQWLNRRMNNSSVVLIHHAFLSWADLYLDKAHPIVYYVKDLKTALNVAFDHDFDSVYLVWWNENVGWYDLTVPEYFVSVFCSGRISAFKYIQLEV